MPLAYAAREDTTESMSASKSESRSRSESGSHSHSQTQSRSQSKSESMSHSHSQSQSRSRTMSESHSESQSASKSLENSRTNSAIGWRSASRSRSQSRWKSRSKSKSKSRSKQSDLCDQCSSYRHISVTVTSSPACTPGVDGTHDLVLTTGGAGSCKWTKIIGVSYQLEVHLTAGGVLQGGVTDYNPETAWLWLISGGTKGCDDTGAIDGNCGLQLACVGQSCGTITVNSWT